MITLSTFIKRGYVKFVEQAISKNTLYSDNTISQNALQSYVVRKTDIIISETCQFERRLTSAYPFTLPSGYKNTSQTTNKCYRCNKKETTGIKLPIFFYRI